MAEYSVWSVLRHGLTGNKGWKPTWRKAEPKPSYDVIVVGGGGHGLATAFYPRQGARHPQRRADRARLDRPGQCRPQHHHRPLQLPARRERAFLRVEPEALGGAQPDAELQRHVLAARRAEPRQQSGAARPACAARQRHAAERHRRRAADAGGDRKTLPRPRPQRERALPGRRRAAAAARRHRAARRRRLGLCACRRPARRRHHRELRGDRLPEGRRPHRRRGDRAAARSARRKSASRSPA